MTRDPMPPQSNRRRAPRTFTAQALGEVDERTRALVPPIHMSSTFERDADGGYRSGRGYARPHSPAYDQPEALLAALEGGADAMALASGMAAATTVFQALLPGDHVVAPRVMYWALRKWLVEFAVPWGLAVEFVDMTDLAALARALRPGQTRLVWLETPANPTWAITDIAAAADLAHAAGARVAVDSTVATPVITRPLEHGADLVVHSASKYLNGHGDVIAGALVARHVDALWQRMKAWRRDAGGILGPFESWLLLRGMRTLFVRVAESSASARRVAEHFDGHPGLLEVLYPGLPTHPGHAVAARQMDGQFGAMLSIRLRGGEPAAVATAAAVEVFTRATSLGGVESLIEHRASIEGPATPVPFDLLRLSIGLEDPADLIADLEAALERAAEAAPQSVPVGTGPSSPDAAPGADVLERVRHAVAAQIAPMVLERGAALTVQRLDHGTVVLRYTGSPGAVLGLHGELENLLRHYVPDIVAVRLEPGDGHPEPPAGGSLGERVHQVLDGHVNPAVAAHGGRIELVGVDGGAVRLRMCGRCQGCALADVTFRQGVEALLRELAPDVEQVIDTTVHAEGSDPYFKTKKGD